jgi:hypothetical protein
VRRTTLQLTHAVRRAAPGANADSAVPDTLCRELLALAQSCPPGLSAGRFGCQAYESTSLLDRF